MKSGFAGLNKFEYRESRLKGNLNEICLRVNAGFSCCESSSSGSSVLLLDELALDAVHNRLSEVPNDHDQQNGVEKSKGLFHHKEQSLEYVIGPLHVSHLVCIVLVLKKQPIIVVISLVSMYFYNVFFYAWLLWFV